MPTDLTEFKDNPKVAVDNQRLILAVISDRLPETTRQETALIPMTTQEVFKTLYDAGPCIGPRAILEDQPFFRQIIPYIALRFNGKFIKYVRTPKGGEERLHGMTSIGLGGHIDFSDLYYVGNSIDISETVKHAAFRELQEELGKVRLVDWSMLGLVVANRNPVDAVHIGVAMVFDVSHAPDGEVEDALEQVALASLEELAAMDPASIETWSQLIIQHLVDLR